MAESGFNFDDLAHEAKKRWLKPAEVFSILRNHEKLQITPVAPEKPASGSLFLFNKRVLRFFRKDGHRWRRKKDGRAGGEAHERLKVGNVEALNCYYAHGEQNPKFQRRSYWMLDPAYEHIVLVHYRDISQGIQSAQSVPQLSPVSFTINQSPIPYSIQYTSSTADMGESCEPYSIQYTSSMSTMAESCDPFSIQYTSSAAAMAGSCGPYSSPGITEISSFAVTNSNGINQSNNTVEEDSSSSVLEINQALRRIEQQLSLKDDSLNNGEPLYNTIEYSSAVDNIQDDHNSINQIPDDSNSDMSQQHSGDLTEYPHQLLGHEVNAWEDMVDGYMSSVDTECAYVDGKGILLARNLVETPENIPWLNFNGEEAQNSSMSIPQQVEDDFRYPTNMPAIITDGTNPDQFLTSFNQDQIGISFDDNMSLTIDRKEKFRIKDLSPAWGYADEATKVIIIGSFLCDPSESEWMCMFGDIEVPVQIIQEGALCCCAPPHLPDKVSICITTGNQESCSDVREFEYRVKPTSKNTEELLLLVRFAKLLLSEESSRCNNIDSPESGNNFWEKVKVSEDLWSEVIQGLLVGNSTPNLTVDWLLQELFKDKLQQWIDSKLKGKSSLSSSDSVLSRKEQGVIHMVAGLGFEWALQPVLDAGVTVNFRDINGWTALHWAARFGREKMVAALIASGASAGAVTDPTKQDPTGQNPAAIADRCGHKGLAGYLSEVALTSHLSSLTLEETKHACGATEEEEPERTVQCNSGTSNNEDQLSMKDTLAAAHNAAQAAARIQAAFRLHSFRKRQQREAAAAAATAAFWSQSFNRRQQREAGGAGAGAGAGDEYDVILNDIQGLLAAPKLTFRTPRDYNSAAITIQKKYRGWKGRKDFLAFRKKVVKIQAHVRGYQVRKEYRVCWATGILEKLILRWRRRGVGLRGFHPEIDESEDEDILKVFRKQKVDKAIDEAVKRVLSMVESQEARQQYRRLLEKYRHAKALWQAKRQSVEAGEKSSHGGISNMENDE